MNDVILIDFGSTFTKSTVVDRKLQRVVYTFRTPSTVGTDASIGLRKCLDAISNAIGQEAMEQADRLASSSAAGGLRMIVVGLTDSLSMTAGRNAAYGAGAKVLKAFSGILTADDLQEIADIQPEILFLCGGYEHGNSDWVWQNAQLLAQDPSLHMPVVYAGNSQIGEQVRLLFRRQDKPCILAENIIPAIGELNIESSVEAVRDIFMKRIVHMKGFDTVKKYVGDIVMPTPAAVLSGVRLLAEGTLEQPGWEQVMLVDMGGATTDVHSYAAQDTLEGVHIVGAREPKAKRTVEGDIGARESCNSLLEAADMARFKALSGLTKEEIAACRDERLSNHAFVARTEKEIAFENAMAMEAVRVSTRRHAGRIFAGFAEGAQEIQKGKNLRNVKAIIGTGGPIIDNPDPKRVLEQALRTAREKDVLLPDQADFYLDTSYIFYAAGLLSQKEPDLAFQILSTTLTKLR